MPVKWEFYLFQSEYGPAFLVMQPTHLKWSRAASGDQARREGGRRGHYPGTQGARGLELSGLKCKIHQLKLGPADEMMSFF